MLAACRHGREAGGEVAVACEMFFILEAEAGRSSTRHARQFRISRTCTRYVSLR